ncbi:hypothetical protein CHUAL_007337 [Chamberlinius hualienensis]
MNSGISIISSSATAQLQETHLERSGCLALCRNLLDSDISCMSVQLSSTLGLVSIQNSSIEKFDGGLGDSDDEQSSIKKCRNSANQFCALPLKESLFPLNPPTFCFSYTDNFEYVLPEGLKSAMLWQLTNTTPCILKKLLIKSGFQFTNSLYSWIGSWGKSKRAYEYKELSCSQKFNHFPGTFQIGRKDRLWRTIYRMRLFHSKKEFDFVPDTYIIPTDLKKFLTAWDSECGDHRWIVKPPASARGKGVYVIHQTDQLPKQTLCVVQKYLSKPFLINETKFDLRVYVYVPSFNPLRIYVYEDGLVRFASLKFSTAVEALDDSYIHLTNYTINKNHHSYTISEDVHSCEGNKWSLKTLWTHLKRHGVNTSKIWDDIIDLIIKTIISCESSVRILSQENVDSYTCHELFGFDVILDENLKPLLLEVNVSPSLVTHSSLDKAIKGNMMAELLNLAQYRLPSKLSNITKLKLAQKMNFNVKAFDFDHIKHHIILSNEELLKQRTYSVYDREKYIGCILDNLTLNDVICLTEAEDELTKKELFQRVFPSKTSSTYHKYFNKPQYYTNLLDAWEHKYENRRNIGII